MSTIPQLLINAIVFVFILIIPTVGRADNPNTQDMIFSLQAGLKCMGYNITQIDGVMGPETKAAVTQYINEHAHELQAQLRPKHDFTDNSASDRIPQVAENSSYYGQLNENGVPKTVYVGGYYRSDGTYVKSHFRSPPNSNQPSMVSKSKGPGVAENGSYYGEPSKITGKLKTVHVKGYYRKDGTYVRGHYRSK